MSKYAIINVETLQKRIEELERQRELVGNVFEDKNYLFNIQGCPGYEGYVPKRLGHEVCKYCGVIEYYH